MQEHGDASRPAQPDEVSRWRQRLADERAECRVYRELATRREGEERQILLELAEAEERHAEHWEQMLGDQVGPARPSLLRRRLLLFLAHRFGSVFMLALVQRAESRSPYEADTDATPAMAADERVHAEVVRALAARGRARLSGRLRAAVFGANDGLVSNLALVVGVAAGGAGATGVLLTGLAGLLSGALSMGAGEYISVRSQRELLAASTPDPGVRMALPHLDVDANELALVYRARGMDADEAQRRADERLRDYRMPDPAQPRRDEQDGEVVGSSVAAAVSSFAFFAAGAAVPVVPFLAGLTGGVALVTAVSLVGGALLVTGSVVGVVSGGPPLQRALRQLGIGAGAAAATYLLGLLFGAIVG